MTKRYNIVTRCIAAIALVLVYFVGASAILVGSQIGCTREENNVYANEGGDT